MAGFRKLWQSLCLGKTRARRKGRSKKPLFEALEDRTVPSTVSIVKVYDGFENGGDGIFRVSRDDTNGNLMVFLSFDAAHSTAVVGTDIQTPPSYAVIPNGASYVDVHVAANNDGEVEAPETVALKIEQSFCEGAPVYTIDSTGSASLTLSDDPYIDYVGQLDQGYVADVESAAATRLDATNSARATDLTSADQAYIDYQAAVSTAKATYIATFKGAVSDYEGVLDQAASTGVGAYNQAMDAYNAALASADSSYNTAIGGDSQTYTNALNDADAAYSEYIATYQTTRDAAYAAYQANPDDPATQQAFTDADNALNSAITDATSQRDGSRADAQVVYDAAQAADHEALVNALSAASTVYDSATATAAAAWSSSEAAGWNTLSAATTSATVLFTSAESSAWTSYPTTLTSLDTTRITNESIAQSVYDSSVASALSTWQTNEQTAWTSYLSEISVPQAPPQQDRITVPGSVQVPPLPPFEGMPAAQPRDDLVVVAQVSGAGPAIRAIAITDQVAEVLGNNAQIANAGAAWGALPRRVGEISTPADSVTITVSHWAYAPIVNFPIAVRRVQSVVIFRWVGPSGNGDAGRVQAQIPLRNGGSEWVNLP